MVLKHTYKWRSNIIFFGLLKRALLINQTKLNLEYLQLLENHNRLLWVLLSLLSQLDIQSEDVWLITISWYVSSLFFNEFLIFARQFFNRAYQSHYRKLLGLNWLKSIGVKNNTMYLSLFRSNFVIISLC